MMYTEFLKTSSSKLLIAVTTLFNIVLQTGKIPHACLLAILVLFIKEKEKRMTQITIGV